MSFRYSNSWLKITYETRTFEESSHALPQGRAVEQILEEGGDRGAQHLRVVVLVEIARVTGGHTDAGERADRMEQSAAQKQPDGCLS